MTRSHKRIAGTAVAVGVLTLCALLPAGLARLRDFRQLDAIHTVEIEPVSLGGDGTYTLAERLRLLSGEYAQPDAQTMSFHTGINYTHKTAQQNAKEQIDAMQQAGLLPEGSGAYREIFVDGVEFTADSADPACSLMLWEIYAMSERYFLTLEMDDETGKILLCHVSSRAEEQDWLEDVDLQAAAQAWSEYLGVPLGEEDGLPPWQKDGIWRSAVEKPAGQGVRALWAPLAGEGAPAGYQFYADGLDFWIAVA